jgi:4-amino-4-deoxy-L-arabinose transferase-like glycosyltransferase
MAKKEANSDSIATPAQRSSQALWPAPLLVALVGFAVVVLTIDPDQCCSYAASGPGITIDESFNVEQGVYLIGCVKLYGIGLLDPQSQREIFDIKNRRYNPDHPPLGRLSHPNARPSVLSDSYNPDHPPLGRLWLGAWHLLAESVAPGRVLNDHIVTVSARWGSAAAFGCTIFLVGVFTAGRFGKTSGTVAAVSLLIMPRLFAHAHLAALESITNLVWSAALLSVAHWWASSSVRGSKNNSAPSTRTAILTGVVLGLALLTKIQAIILPPLVVVWALWHWRTKAILPLLVWGATGFFVFCIGWPYLWFDFIPRLTEYFASSSDRAVVNVWYLGDRLPDVAAPWHYPWVMFCSTIPIGLLALGVFGISKQRVNLFQSPAIGLVFGAVVAPLVLFSIPGVAVYDGVRLFLVSFPAFCIFVGIGFQAFVEWLAPRNKHANLLAYSFLAIQAVGLIWMHPFQLSYYSGLVGGTAGAARLGFEPTYWSDSINPELIDQLPNDESIEVLVAPLLHQFQVDVLNQQCPTLANKRITKLNALDPCGEFPQRLLLFHRKANAPTEAELTKLGWTKTSACRRQGVELASIWSRK